MAASVAVMNRRRKMRAIRSSPVELFEEQMVVKSLSVPPGLETLMEGLTKEVLKVQPRDICMFASDYFAKLIKLRENAGDQQYCKSTVHQKTTLQQRLALKQSHHPKNEVEFINAGKLLSVPRLYLGKLKNESETKSINNPEIKNSRSEASTAEIDKLQNGFFETTNIDDKASVSVKDFEMLTTKNDNQSTSDVNDADNEQIGAIKIISDTNGEIEETELIAQNNNEEASEEENGKQDEISLEEKDKETDIILTNRDEQDVIINENEETDIIAVSPNDKTYSIIEGIADYVKEDNETTNKHNEAETTITDVLEDIEAATVQESEEHGIKKRSILDENISNLEVPEISTTVATPLPSDEETEIQNAIEEEDEVKEKKAAIRIQSIWRGFKVRNKKELKVPENEENTSLTEKVSADLIKAATVIQSLWRGYNIRKLNKSEVGLENAVEIDNEIAIESAKLVEIENEIKEVKNLEGDIDKTKDNIEKEVEIQEEEQYLADKFEEIDELDKPETLSEDVENIQKALDNMKAEVEQSVEKAEEKDTLNELKENLELATVEDATNIETTLENGEAAQELADTINTEIAVESEVLEGDGTEKPVTFILGAEEEDLDENGDIKDHFQQKVAEDIVEDGTEIAEDQINGIEKAKSTGQIHELIHDNIAISPIENIDHAAVISDDNQEETEKISADITEAEDTNAIDSLEYKTEIEIADEISNDLEKLKAWITDETSDKLIENEGMKEKSQLILSTSGDELEHLNISSPHLEETHDLLEIKDEGNEEVNEQNKLKAAEEVIMKALGLQHSGEMHDSLDLQMTSDDLKIEEIVELQHSGEMHDSIDIPVHAANHEIEENYIVEEAEEEIKENLSRLKKQTGIDISEVSGDEEENDKHRENTVIIEEIAAKLDDSVNETLETVMNTTNDAEENVTDAVKEVNDLIEEKAVELEDTTTDLKDNLISAMDNTVDAVENAKIQLDELKEEINDGTNENVTKLENAVTDVEANLSNTLQDTVDSVKTETTHLEELKENIENEIEEKATELKETVTDTTDNIAITLKETNDSVEVARNQLEELEDQLEVGIEEKTVELNETVNELTNNADNILQETVDIVENAEAQMEKNVKQTIDEVKEAESNLENEVTEVVELIDNNTQNVIEEAKKEMNEASSKIADNANNIKEDFKDIEENIEVKVSDAVEEISDNLRENIDNNEKEIADTINENLEALSLEVENIENNISDTINENLEEISANIENLENKMEGKIENVINETDEDKNNFVTENSENLQIDINEEDDVTTEVDKKDDEELQINENEAEVVVDNDKNNTIDEIVIKAGDKAAIIETVLNENEETLNSQEDVNAIAEEVKDYMEEVKDNINEVGEEVNKTLEQDLEDLVADAESKEGTEVDTTQNKDIQDLNILEENVIETEVVVSKDDPTNEEIIEIKENNINDTEEEIVGTEEDTREQHDAIIVDLAENNENLNKSLTENLTFDSEINPDNITDTKTEFNEEVVSKKLNKDEAATKIQATWRGFNVRRTQDDKENALLSKPAECDELSHQRGDTDEEEDREQVNKAATAIQSGVRGYLVRKRRHLLSEDTGSINNSASESISQIIDEQNSLRKEEIEQDIQKGNAKVEEAEILNPEAHIEIKVTPKEVEGNDEIEQSIVEEEMKIVDTSNKIVQEISITETENKDNTETDVLIETTNDKQDLPQDTAEVKESLDSDDVVVSAGVEDHIPKGETSDNVEQEVIDDSELLNLRLKNLTKINVYEQNDLPEDKPDEVPKSEDTERSSDSLNSETNNKEVEEILKNSSLTSSPNAVNLDNFDSTRYDLKSDYLTPQSKNISPMEELLSSAYKLGARLSVNDDKIVDAIDPKGDMEEKAIEYIVIPLQGPMPVVEEPIKKEYVSPRTLKDEPMIAPEKDEDSPEYIYIPLKDPASSNSEIFDESIGLLHSGEMHDSLGFPHEENEDTKVGDDFKNVDKSGLLHSGEMHDSLVLPEDNIQESKDDDATIINLQHSGEIHDMLDTNIELINEEISNKKSDLNLLDNMSNTIDNENSVVQNIEEKNEALDNNLELRGENVLILNGDNSISEERKIQELQVDINTNNGIQEESVKIEEVEDNIASDTLKEDISNASIEDFALRQHANLIETNDLHEKGYNNVETKNEEETFINSTLEKKIIIMKEEEKASNETQTAEANNIETIEEEISAKEENEKTAITPTNIEEIEMNADQSINVFIETQNQISENTEDINIISELPEEKLVETDNIDKTAVIEETVESVENKNNDNEVSEKEISENNRGTKIDEIHEKIVPIKETGVSAENKILSQIENQIEVDENKTDLTNLSKNIENEINILNNDENMEKKEMLITDVERQDEDINKNEEIVADEINEKKGAEEVNININANEQINKINDKCENENVEEIDLEKTDKNITTETEIEHVEKSGENKNMEEKDMILTDVEEQEKDNNKNEEILVDKMNEGKAIEGIIISSNDIEQVNEINDKDDTTNVEEINLEEIKKNITIEPEIEDVQKSDENENKPDENNEDDFKEQIEIIAENETEVDAVQIIEEVRSNEGTVDIDAEEIKKEQNEKNVEVTNDEIMFSPGHESCNNIGLLTDQNDNSSQGKEEFNNVINDNIKELALPATEQHIVAENINLDLNENTTISTANEETEVIKKEEILIEEHNNGELSSRENESIAVSEEEPRMEKTNNVIIIHTDNEENMMEPIVVEHINSNGSSINKENELQEKEIIVEDIVNEQEDKNMPEGKEILNVTETIENNKDNEEINNDTINIDEISVKETEDIEHENENIDDANIDLKTEDIVNETIETTDDKEIVLAETNVVAKIDDSSKDIATLSNNEDKEETSIVHEVTEDKITGNADTSNVGEINKETQKFDDSGENESTLQEITHDINSDDCLNLEEIPKNESTLEILADKNESSEEVENKDDVKKYIENKEQIPEGIENTNDKKSEIISEEGTHVVTQAVNDLNDNETILVAGDNEELRFAEEHQNTEYNIDSVDNMLGTEAISKSVNRENEDDNKDNIEIVEDNEIYINNVIKENLNGELINNKETLSVIEENKVKTTADVNEEKIIEINELDITGNTEDENVIEETITANNNEVIQTEPIKTTEQKENIILNNIEEDKEEQNIKGNNESETKVTELVDLKGDVIERDVNVANKSVVNEAVTNEEMITVEEGHNNDENIDFNISNKDETEDTVIRNIKEHTENDANEIDTSNNQDLSTNIRNLDDNETVSEITLVEKQSDTNEAFKQTIEPDHNKELEDNYDNDNNTNIQKDSHTEDGIHANDEHKRSITVIDEKEDKLIEERSRESSETPIDSIQIDEVVEDVNNDKIHSALTVNFSDTNIQDDNETTIVQENIAVKNTVENKFNENAEEITIDELENEKTDILEYENKENDYHNNDPKILEDNDQKQDNAAKLNVATNENLIEKNNDQDTKELQTNSLLDIENLAASKIQKTYRGYRTRRDVNKQNNIMKENVDSENKTNIGDVNDEASNIINDNEAKEVQSGNILIARHENEIKEDHQLNIDEKFIATEDVSSKDDKNVNENSGTINEIIEGTTSDITLSDIKGEIEGNESTQVVAVEVEEIVNNDVAEENKDVDHIENFSNDVNVRVIENTHSDQQHGTQNIETIDVIENEKDISSNIEEQKQVEITSSTEQDNEDNKYGKIGLKLADNEESNENAADNNIATKKKNSLELNKNEVDMNDNKDNDLKNTNLKQVSNHSSGAADSNTNNEKQDTINDISETNSNIETNKTDSSESQIGKQNSTEINAPPITPRNSPIDDIDAFLERRKSSPRSVSRSSNIDNPSTRQLFNEIDSLIESYGQKRRMSPTENGKFVLESPKIDNFETPKFERSLSKEDVDEDRHMSPSLRENKPIEESDEILHEENKENTKPETQNDEINETHEQSEKITELTENHDDNIIDETINNDSVLELNTQKENVFENESKIEIMKEIEINQTEESNIKEPDTKDKAIHNDNQEEKTVDNTSETEEKQENVSDYADLKEHIYDIKVEGQIVDEPITEGTKHEDDIIEETIVSDNVSELDAQKENIAGSSEIKKEIINEVETNQTEEPEMKESDTKEEVTAHNNNEEDKNVDNSHETEEQQENVSNHAVLKEHINEEAQIGDTKIEGQTVDEPIAEETKHDDDIIEETKHEDDIKEETMVSDNISELDAQKENVAGSSEINKEIINAVETNQTEEQEMKESDTKDEVTTHNDNEEGKIVDNSHETEEQQENVSDHAVLKEHINDEAQIDDTKLEGQTIDEPLGEETKHDDHIIEKTKHDDDIIEETMNSDNVSELDAQKENIPDSTKIKKEIINEVEINQTEEPEMKESDAKDEAATHNVNEEEKVVDNSHETEETQENVSDYAVLKEHINKKAQIDDIKIERQTVDKSITEETKHEDDIIEETMNSDNVSELDSQKENILENTEIIKEMINEVETHQTEEPVIKESDTKDETTTQNDNEEQKIVDNSHKTKEQKGNVSGHAILKEHINEDAQIDDTKIEGQTVDEPIAEETKHKDDIIEETINNNNTSELEPQKENIPENNETKKEIINKVETHQTEELELKESNTKDEATTHNDNQEQEEKIVDNTHETEEKQENVSDHAVLKEHINEAAQTYDTKVEGPTVVEPITEEIKHADDIIEETMNSNNISELDAQKEHIPESTEIKKEMINEVETHQTEEPEIKESDTKDEATTHNDNKEDKIVDNSHGTEEQQENVSDHAILKDHINEEVKIDDTKIKGQAVDGPIAEKTKHEDDIIEETANNNNASKFELQKENIPENTETKREIINEVETHQTEEPERKESDTKDEATTYKDNEEKKNVDNTHETGDQEENVSDHAVLKEYINGEAQINDTKVEVQTVNEPIIKETKHEDDVIEETMKCNNVSELNAQEENIPENTETKKEITNEVETYQTEELEMKESDTKDNDNNDNEDKTTIANIHETEEQQDNVTNHANLKEHEESKIAVTKPDKQIDDEPIAEETKHEDGIIEKRINSDHIPASDKSIENIETEKQIENEDETLHTEECQVIQLEQKKKEESIAEGTNENEEKENVTNIHELEEQANMTDHSFIKENKEPKIEDTDKEELDNKLVHEIPKNDKNKDSDTNIHEASLVEKEHHALTEHEHESTEGENKVDGKENIGKESKKDNVKNSEIEENEANSVAHDLDELKKNVLEKVITEEQDINEENFTAKAGGQHIEEQPDLLEHEALKHQVMMDETDNSITKTEEINFNNPISEKQADIDEHKDDTNTVEDNVNIQGQDNLVEQHARAEGSKKDNKEGKELELHTKLGNIKIVNQAIDDEMQNNDLKEDLIKHAEKENEPLQEEQKNTVVQNELNTKELIDKEEEPVSHANVKEDLEIRKETADDIQNEVTENDLSEHAKIEQEVDAQIEDNSTINKNAKDEELQEVDQKQGNKLDNEASEESVEASIGEKIQENEENKEHASTEQLVDKKQIQNPVFENNDKNNLQDIENIAATTIQNAYRGYRAKRDTTLQALKPEERKNSAETNKTYTIEAVSSPDDISSDEDNIKNAAASKIQSSFRNYRVKRSLSLNDAPNVQTENGQVQDLKINELEDKLLASPVRDDKHHHDAQTEELKDFSEIAHSDVLAQNFNRMYKTRHSLDNSALNVNLDTIPEDVGDVRLDLRSVSPQQNDEEETSRIEENPKDDTVPMSPNNSIKLETIPESISPSLCHLNKEESLSNTHEKNVLNTENESKTNMPGDETSYHNNSENISSDSSMENSHSRGSIDKSTDMDQNIDHHDDFELDSGFARDYITDGEDAEVETSGIQSEDSIYDGDESDAKTSPDDNLEQGRRRKMDAGEDYEERRIAPLEESSDINNDTLDIFLSSEELSQGAEMLTSREDLLNTTNDGHEEAKKSKEESVCCGAQSRNQRGISARTPPPADDICAHMEKTANSQTTTVKCSQQNFTPSPTPRITNKMGEGKEETSEQLAATKIQAGFRGYQVRKQMKTKKPSSDNNKDAKRGNSGRRRNSGRAKDGQKSSDLEERSATKIQAGIRGFLVRKRQNKAKDQQA